MGLFEAKNGSNVVIARIEGGREDRQKLVNLGIIPGVPVKIIQKDDQNPMLLSVMGRQVMIGCGMARMIVVR